MLRSAIANPTETMLLNSFTYSTANPDSNITDCKSSWIPFKPNMSDCSFCRWAGCLRWLSQSTRWIFLHPNPRHSLVRSCPHVLPSVGHACPNLKFQISNYNPQKRESTEQYSRSQHCVANQSHSSSLRRNRTQTSLVWEARSSMSASLFIQRLPLASSTMHEFEYQNGLHHIQYAHCFKHQNVQQTAFILF